MKKENQNSRIIQILGIKPILYNPILARISDSVIAGIFMSQLLYWSDKGESNWFYKTIDEIQMETFLKRNEQDRAIRIWNKMEILFLEKRGIPQKRYFLIDNEKLVEEINKIMGSNMKIKRICRKCKRPREEHLPNCPIC